MQANGRNTPSDDESDDSSGSSCSSRPTSSPPLAIARPSTGSLTFYPAYCFKASPTYFTWVKLTAQNVHHDLKVQSGFHHIPQTGAGSTQPNPAQLLFYLNHPIQFIQLVGVVVNFEDYYEKYWLFTIDDSSGATIDITCRKPVAAPPAVAAAISLNPATKLGSTSHPNVDQDGTLDDVAQKQKQKQKTEMAKEMDPDPDPEPDPDPDETDRVAAMKKLDNGVVVQVKGQITTFRRTRQLSLDRITILHETNHEMHLISSRTEYMRRVLSRPWTLTERMQKKLLQDAADERHESEARVLRRGQRDRDIIAREKRHEIRIAEKYLRDQVKRADAAEEARVAGQILQSKLSKRKIK